MITNVNMNYEKYTLLNEITIPILPSNYHMLKKKRNPLPIQKLIDKRQYFTEKEI